MILSSTSAPWITSGKIWWPFSSLPFLQMLAIRPRSRKSFLWCWGFAQKLGFCATVSEVGLFNGSKYIYRYQPNSLFFFLPYGMVVVHFFSIEFEVNSFTQGASLSLPFSLSFFPPHEAVGLENTSPNEKQKELKYLNHWHWANGLFLLSMYESIFLRIHKGEVGRFFIMSLWWHPRLRFLALVRAKDEVAGKGQFS